MIWLGIVIVLLLLLFVGGLILLDYCCGRRSYPDPWSEEAIHKRGFDAIKADILAGKAWVEAQPSEEVSVRSRDGLRLKGLFVPNPDSKGTLLLFHGWRSSWKVDFVIALSFYHSLGLDLLLVDQRAQNGSEGKYITYGVREREDLACWVEWAARRLGREKPLFLGGLSMGASTVLMAADFPFDANVRGIVADCGFTSPYDIIRCVASRGKNLPMGAAMAYLDLFARLLAGFRLKEVSTEETLRRTKLPVLLFHGLAYTFVPPEMSRRSYAACAGERELVLVDGAAHGMSYVVNTGLVQGKIAAFVAAHLEGRPETSV